MARGKKPVTLEERLVEINNDIEETESKLKTLRQAKKDIEAEIKQKEMEEMYGLLQAGGITIEDLKEMLAKKEK